MMFLARLGEPLSVPFEVLNFSFVFFRRPTRCEGPKIPPLSGFGVLLSRVQAVLTRFKFPDHLSVLLWTFNRLIKIGGSLATPPLPHHSRLSGSSTSLEPSHKLRPHKSAPSFDFAQHKLTWRGDFHPTSPVPCPAHTSRVSLKNSVAGFL